MSARAWGVVPERVSGREDLQREELRREELPVAILAQAPPWRARKRAQICTDGPLTGGVLAETGRVSVACTQHVLSEGWHGVSAVQRSLCCSQCGAAEERGIFAHQCSGPGLLVEGYFPQGTIALGPPCTREEFSKESKGNCNTNLTPVASAGNSRREL